jgi:hypothetical protein
VSKSPPKEISLTNGNGNGHLEQDDTSKHNDSDNESNHNVNNNQQDSTLNKNGLEKYDPTKDNEECDVDYGKSGDEIVNSGYQSNEEV